MGWKSLNERPIDRSLGCQENLLTRRIISSKTKVGGPLPPSLNRQASDKVLDLHYLGNLTYVPMWANTLLTVFEADSAKTSSPLAPTPGDFNLVNE